MSLCVCVCLSFKRLCFKSQWAIYLCVCVFLCDDKGCALISAVCVFMWVLVYSVLSVPLSWESFLFVSVSLYADIGCALSHTSNACVCCSYRLCFVTVNVLVCMCCAFWYKLCFDTQGADLCLSAGRRCELRHSEPYVFVLVQAAHWVSVSCPCVRVAWIGCVLIHSVPCVCMCLCNRQCIECQWAMGVCVWVLE